MTAHWAVLAAAAESEELAVNPWLALLAAAVLVLLNGFFVAAEFALVKLRATQLEDVKETARGRLATKMLANIDAYLSASQLGITLASLALGWIGEPAFGWVVESALGEALPPALSHAVSIVIAFSIITTLHIVLGEQAPKTFAIRKPRITTLMSAWPLHLFYLVTYPAIWLLNNLAGWTLALFGMRHRPEGELAVGEEELRHILASESESQLTEEKRELLDNVFELSDRIARQVMVPRSEVVYLDLQAPIEDNLKRARKSGHTRFPLCEGDLDHIVGLVHIKDLFRVNKPLSRLEEVRRDTFFVPETLALEEVLRRMRSERVHMAAVLDEHGGISGIITLENIIEEIVGEIQDEFDSEQPEIITQGDGVFRVLGSTLIKDLEDDLGVALDSRGRDEDTVAGLVLSELGRRAQVGDEVRAGSLKLEVRETDHNRIAALLVTLVGEGAILEPPEEV